MNALMCLKTTLFTEHLMTHITNIRVPNNMYALMFYKTALFTKFLTTHFTWILTPMPMYITGTSAFRTVYMKLFIQITLVKSQSPSIRINSYRITIIFIAIYIYIYRVSQEEYVRLRESVPYAKLYQYNPKHLIPKKNGYGDNSQRKLWASSDSTYCTPSVTSYLSNAPARRDVIEWPWRVRYSARNLWRHKIIDQLPPA